MNDHNLMAQQSYFGLHADAIIMLLLLCSVIGYSGCHACNVSYVSSSIRQTESANFAIDDESVGCV